MGTRSGWCQHKDQLYQGLKPKTSTKPKGFNLPAWHRSRPNWSGGCPEWCGLLFLRLAPPQKPRMLFCWLRNGGRAQVLPTRATAVHFQQLPAHAALGQQAMAQGLRSLPPQAGMDVLPGIGNVNQWVGSPLSCWQICIFRLILTTHPDLASCSGAIYLT